MAVTPLKVLVTVTLLKTVVVLVSVSMPSSSKVLVTGTVMRVVAVDSFDAVIVNNPVMGGLSRILLRIVGVTKASVVITLELMETVVWTVDIFETKTTG